VQAEGVDRGIGKVDLEIVDGRLIHSKRIDRRAETRSKSEDPE
jgi:hypothetical protein